MRRYEGARIPLSSHSRIFNDSSFILDHEFLEFFEWRIEYNALKFDEFDAMKGIFRHALGAKNVTLLLVFL